jgi:hypothetical protein
VAGRLLSKNLICGGSKAAYLFCMSAGQAVLVVGVSLVSIAGLVWVMMRIDRSSSALFRRRREAWKAEGNVGPYPGDSTSGGGYGGGFSPPGG